MKIWTSCWITARPHDGFLNFDVNFIFGAVEMQTEYICFKFGYETYICLYAFRVYGMENHVPSTSWYSAL